MKDITKFWFLKDFDLFQKLGQKNLMSIFSSLRMVHVKKGEILHLIREDRKVVYFIKTGIIKIMGLQNSQTISILKAGNIFGELDLYNDSTSNSNEEKAEVMLDSVVCLIESDRMKVIMENHSSLKNQLLKLQGLKIKRLKRNLEDLLYKDSETRIKEFILNFVKQFGSEKDGALIAKNFISQNDIAHLTNTSRQTVSNVMSKLRMEGDIDYNANEILVKSAKY